MPSQSPTRAATAGAAQPRGERVLRGDPHAASSTSTANQRSPAGVSGAGTDRRGSVRRMRRARSSRLTARPTSAAIDRSRRRRRPPSGTRGATAVATQLRQPGRSASRAAPPRRPPGRRARAAGVRGRAGRPGRRRCRRCRRRAARSSSGPRRAAASKTSRQTARPPRARVWATASWTTSMPSDGWPRAASAAVSRPGPAADVERRPGAVREQGEVRGVGGAGPVLDRKSRRPCRRRSPPGTPRWRRRARTPSRPPPRSSGDPRDLGRDLARTGCRGGCGDRGARRRRCRRRAAARRRRPGGRAASSAARVSCVRRRGGHRYVAQRGGGRRVAQRRAPTSRRPRPGRARRRCVQAVGHRRQQRPGSPAGCPCRSGRPVRSTRRRGRSPAARRSRVPRCGATVQPASAVRISSPRTASARSPASARRQPVRPTACAHASRVSSSAAAATVGGGRHRRRRRRAGSSPGPAPAPWRRPGPSWRHASTRQKSRAVRSVPRTEPETFERVPAARGW